MRMGKLLTWGLLALSILSIVANFVFHIPFPLFFFFIPPLFFGRKSFSSDKETQSNNYIRPKFCQNCGNRLKPSWEFCPYCSQPIQ